MYAKVVNSGPWMYGRPWMYAAMNGRPGCDSRGN
jgi:hypothetical protein